MSNNINDQFTKQFDELGLSIADLIAQDAECKKVYDQAIKHNMCVGESLSDCIAHANYQVKVFVVERQNELDGQSYEYFNLSFTPDEAFGSWENVYKETLNN